MRATGVRRKNDKERLLLSFSKKDFLRSVKYTVEQANQWVAQKRYSQKWTESELIAAYKKCAAERVYDLNQVPPLIWDPTLESKPQLDRGQHRREAMLKEYATTSWTTLTPESWSVCFPDPVRYGVNNCSY